MTDRQIPEPWPGTAEALAEAIWRKSSYSGTQGNCVEVAVGPQATVLVRDSKDPDSAVLSFTPVQWQAFLWRV